MLRRILLMIGFSLLLLGCDQAVDEIGYGNMKGNQYTNDYFDVSIKLPENWLIQSKAENEALLKEGLEDLTESNQMGKLSAKLTLMRTVTLFSVYKYDQNSDVPAFNSSMISLGEKAGGNTVSKYFSAMKRQLESSSINYSISEKMRKKNVSGVMFYILPAIVKAEGYQIHQDYYAKKIKDYMLVYILTYVDDTDKKILEDSLKTIVRKKK